MKGMTEQLTSIKKNSKNKPTKKNQKKKDKLGEV